MGTSIQFGLDGEYVFQIRVMGKGNEFFENMPRHHALFFSEDGEKFSFPSVMSQKFVEIFSHDSRTVFATQFDTGGLEDVGFTKTQ